MKKRTLEERFTIPITGNYKIKFYTKCGTLLATGYDRIVIGGRGPYIEFNTAQLDHTILYVPKFAQHKLDMSLTYYHEYRTRDTCNIKVYHQKMEVSYADYKIGKWYIDPQLLKTDQFENILLPLYGEEIKEEKENIFDIV